MNFALFSLISQTLGRLWNYGSEEGHTNERKCWFWLINSLVSAYAGASCSKGWVLVIFNENVQFDGI